MGFKAHCQKDTTDHGHAVLKKKKKSARCRSTVVPYNEI